VTDPCEFFWPARRVLLTGHCGYKGSWLLLWLKQLDAWVWRYPAAIARTVACIGLTTLAPVP